MAIQHCSLIGFAYVEVNGKKGIIITVRTGSGQGDPISSILFLLATEPLNRALVQNYRNLMYTTEGNLTVGPILFADDNLNPLSIERANDICTTDYRPLQSKHNSECSQHKHQKNHSSLHLHLTQNHPRTKPNGD